MHKTDKKQTKPFFARFLVSQELQDVTGGGDDIPLPRPPKPPVDVTQKEPSDNEDRLGGDYDI